MLYKATARGQSLVETALFIPILVLFMIGVLEVGWALRGYLVLANANREAARFAIRPGYLDFSQPDPGWQKVKMQAVNAIGGQIPVDFENEGTLIAAYIEVATGVLPPITTTNYLDVCKSIYTPTILTPLDISTFTVVYGKARVTHFDYRILGTELAGRNREQNCDLSLKSGIARNDGLIIVEMWYDQPHLIHLIPLIDPIPMYTHTIMRRIEAARGTGKE